MLDSLFLRIVIILYLIIVLFTLSLLWKNSAAPDALKNGGILIASLLPVLIAVLPYLNKQTQKTNFSFNLFYDSTAKSLTTGEGHNSYRSAYTPVLANLNTDDVKGENFEEFTGIRGMDLIEKGIVSELISQFGVGWDIKKVRHSLPNSQADFFDLHTDLPSTIIQLKELQGKFTHNKLIVRPNVLVGKSLTLPGNSNLKTSHSANERLIKISNPQFSISIKINYLLAGVSQHGIPGLFTTDTANPNRYYNISFGVEITMTAGRFSRYSPQMPAFQRFYENICDSLNTMNWQEVQFKLEKSLLDSAINKILQ